MPKSKSEILNDFEELIGKYGDKYKESYVGTASDAKSQLFKTHKFKSGENGLYREADSEIQAAGVAEYFTNLGAKGDPEIKKDADCVYAYRIAPHIKP